MMVGEQGPWCFCRVGARSTLSKKDKKTIYFCGTIVDYNAISKADRIRDARERENALKELNLGCNLKLNEDDLKAIYTTFGGSQNLPTMKMFPQCYCHLFTKMCVSHSSKNNNRPFFACAAPLPNYSCGYFKWCSDFWIANEDGQLQLVQRQDAGPPPAKKIKEDDVLSMNQSGSFNWFADAGAATNHLEWK